MPSVLELIGLLEPGGAAKGLQKDGELMRQAAMHVRESEGQVSVPAEGGPAPQPSAVTSS